jgi:hypothetical protein
MAYNLRNSGLKFAPSMTFTLLKYILEGDARPLATTSHMPLEMYCTMCISYQLIDRLKLIEEFP